LVIIDPMKWSNSLTESGLRSQLEKITDRTVTDHWGAAVLVPFVRESDGWHLLFIRRAEHQDDAHSGQVAFPGGMVEGCDFSPADCALREAGEEIGLAAGRVSVVGPLPSQRALKGFCVQPVVGIADWPLSLRVDPAEVSHWFTVPIEWLADPQNHQMLSVRSSDGVEHFTNAFREYCGERVWGLTARIVINLLESVG